MDNKPNSGRGKKIIGKTDSFGKTGSGLGAGKPAGKDVSYSKRPQSGGSYSGGSGGHNRAMTRGLGGGGLIIVIILAFFLLKSCGGSGGGLLSGLFGGGGSSIGSGGLSILDGLSGGGSYSGGSGNSGSSSSSSSSGLDLFSGLGGLLGGGGSSSGSSGLDLSSMLGGYSGGGSASTGWARTANTGKLDSTVAKGARAKYTNILGNGRDTWTFMIYMCGTDLESKSGMASNDLQEMAKATLNNNINIIIFTGGCKQWKIKGISNTVNQIYKLENGALTCLVSDAGKDSMVKPATLTSFIQFCTKNYPANRQALIFWDHGGGSVSGYGYDEKNASLGSMGLSGIDSALKNAGTKFDFIGFDACLMATLETGLVMNDYADYMIASEETEPGIGWYYTNWLTKLAQNTSMPTIEIGKNIVDDFVSECNRRCAGQATTLSVVDLAELSATVPASLKSFSTGTSKLLSGNEYKTVSDARSGTREFAASSRIDQIDLVHLCYNLATPESEALAKTLLGAVKYNKTSSSITNAYGISIFFPYKNKNYVKSAVNTYNAIGLDSEYSRCIQQFATLEQGGQMGSSSGYSSFGGLDIGSLLGGSSSASGSAADFGSIFGSLLGGGRSLDLDAATAAQTVADNQFDAANLSAWTNYEGHKVLKLDPAQWEQVHSLQLNVFYNDGDGFINLGLDNMYKFTKDGALLGEYDCTWVAMGSYNPEKDEAENVQPVMFNYQDAVLDGDELTTTGTVPVLLNGEMANLVVVFVDNIKTGTPLDAYVAGVRYDYEKLELEQDAVSAEAKVAELQDGDEIQFVADYYTKDGEFEDCYKIGDPISYQLFNADKRYDEEGYDRADFVPDGNLIVGYTDMSALKDQLVATYLFTDIYNNEHWTLPLSNVVYEN
ncbi:MAG: peptidase C11 [Oscillospiraceae bacterium]|nr:peptidase C11 [Oscillospiraceae bacterium]